MNDFFKNPLTYIIALVLLLGWTTYHSLELYWWSFPEASYLQTSLVVGALLVIDFCVVLFTFNQIPTLPEVYSSTVFIINLFAFWKEIELPTREVSTVIEGAEVLRTVNDFDLLSTDVFLFLPGLLFSALIAICLYQLSALFHQHGTAFQSAKAAESDRSKLEKEVESLENQLATIGREKIVLEELLSHSRKQDTERFPMLEKLILQLESQQELLSNLGKPSKAVEIDAETWSETYRLALQVIAEQRGIFNTQKYSVKKSLDNWNRRIEENGFAHQEKVAAHMTRDMYQLAFELKQQEA